MATKKNKGDFSMKNIIIVGLGKDFLEFFSKRFPFGCFNIVCATDFNTEFKKNAELINTHFVQIDEAMKLDFDFIIISDRKKYEEYYDLIMKNYKWNSSKIMSEKEISGFSVDENFAYHEFSFSFGEENKNITFYIIRPTYSIGLFACSGRAIAEFAYAEEHKWIPIVDMQNYPNMYLPTKNLYKENSWEYFFKQVSNYSLKEVYSSKNVVFGDVRNARRMENWLKGGDIYKNKLWNKVIKLKDNLQDELEEEYHRLVKGSNGQKILGVLLRGTDYVNLQPENHAIQPSSSEMIKIAAAKLKEWDCKYIYLSTEDATILREFQKFFGTRLLFTNQVRYENTGNRFLASIKTDRNNDEVKRGKEYLISIMLLSRCNNLITSICGGGNVVKMINGNKYENCITINKGIYRCDNEVKTIFESKNIVLLGGKDNAKYVETIVRELLMKYNKSVYILSQKINIPNCKSIDNLESIEKPFGIIIDIMLDKT